MATTSLRTTVKARLVEVFTAVLPGVQVFYGVTDRDQPREAVYVGDVRGKAHIANMTGPQSRKRRDDDFSVDCWVIAAQIGQTAQTAEERAETIFASIEDALADPTVAGPNLYGGGTFSAIVGLVSAVIGETDLRCGPGDSGWIANLMFTVDVRTRLT